MNKTQKMKRKGNRENVKYALIIKKNPRKPAHGTTHQSLIDTQWLFVISL